MSFSTSVSKEPAVSGFIFYSEDGHCTNQPYYMASDPRIQYLKISQSYASSKLKPHPILAGVFIFPHSAVNPVL